MMTWTDEDQKQHEANIAADNKAVDDFLLAIFGKKPEMATTGSNGGEDLGLKYNAKMAELGFTEMETGMGRKPIEALGQKPQLRTKWKQINRIKATAQYCTPTTFYQLLDSDAPVIMATTEGYRYLYWI